MHIDFFHLIMGTLFFSCWGRIPVILYPTCDRSTPSPLLSSPPTLNLLQMSIISDQVIIASSHPATKPLPPPTSCLWLRVLTLSLTTPLCITVAQQIELITAFFPPKASVIDHCCTSFHSCHSTFNKYVLVLCFSYCHKC